MHHARWLLIVVIMATLSLAYGSSFDLDGYDSAELALVAVTGGLGHPPGQPLHTVLGWVLTRLGAPLVALTLLSIVPAAMVFALGGFRAHQSGATSGKTPVNLQRILTACIAVLAVSFAPVRDVSVRVEVYALAALFVLMAMHTAQASLKAQSLLTGALLGCAAATNPVLAVQGTGALWLLAQKQGSSKDKVRALLGASFSALAVFALCYGYAFAATARETQTLVWSAPTDFRSLMTVLMARDFAQNISLSFTSVVSNVLSYGLSLTLSGCGLWLAVGMVGLLRKDADQKRDPWWPAALIALVVGVLMVAANGQYRENNPDYGGYLLVACGLCTKGVLRLFLSYDLSKRISTGILLAVLTLTVGATWHHGRSAGVVRALATRVLEQAPPRAMAVVGADHLLFPLLYLQRVEHRRTDVTVLNPGWASSRWAWKWAMAMDPSLVVQLQPGIGREARLTGVLQQRANRAVIAELPSALTPLREPGNSICPRGIFWSTQEGCDASTRSTRATVEWLQSLRTLSDQRRDRWGQRFVRHTAVQFGDGLRVVGCSGVAVRVYAAGLGQMLSSAGGLSCGFAGNVHDPEPDVLTVDDTVLTARMATARRDRVLEPR